MNAFFFEILFQFCIVLNDAVVNDGQVFRLRIMRMSIHRRRFAVRCPACVGNAHGPADVLVSTKLFKAGHFAFGLIDTKFPIIVKKCYAG